VELFAIVGGHSQTNLLDKSKSIVDSRVCPLLSCCFADSKEEALLLAFSHTVVPNTSTFYLLCPIYSRNLSLCKTEFARLARGGLKNNQQTIVS